MRFEINDHNCAEQCRNAYKSDRSDVTRTHEGDYYKGKEENQCRTEVLHEEKCADTAEGEYKIFCKASSALKLVQRRRSDEDKRKLDKLGRLNGHAAYRDPIQCAVGVFCKRKVGDEQSDRRKGNGHSQLHNDIRASHNDEHEDEQNKSERNGDDLLERIVIIDRSNVCQTNTREKKTDYFKLKVILSAENRGDDEIRPFEKNIACIDCKQSAVETVGGYYHRSGQHLKYGNEDKCESPVEFIVQFFSAHIIPPCEYNKSIYYNSFVGKSQYVWNYFTFIGGFSFSYYIYDLNTVKKSNNQGLNILTFLNDFDSIN